MRTSRLVRDARAPNQRSRSSLRRPGAPAGCSRCERSLDTPLACAASSRVVRPAYAPPPLWPRLSASGDSDANTAAKLGIVTHRDLRRFHQQHAQHAIALLGDGSQLLPSARGVLARNQSQITGYLLAAWKAADIAHGQHIGQSCDRSHSGLGLKRSSGI